MSTTTRFIAKARLAAVIVPLLIGTTSVLGQPRPAERDADGEPARETADAATLFERRLVPFVRSQKASSCTECHFGGVDLTQYIGKDEATTFASLRAAGLIDVERPDESKLLQFIQRRPDNEDPVMAKVRSQEETLFTQWIRAAVKNPALLAAKPPRTTNGDSEPRAQVGPQVDVEVIRHGRRDRVLESFVENFWIEVERCAGCHSPDRNQRQVEKFGEQVSWIKPNDPAGTLAILIDHQLIDTEEPDKSLILQKPLNEVEHAGHIKFGRGSRTDKQYRRFLHDYAAVVNEKYRLADDLPKATPFVPFPTGQHLRITELPREYRGRPLRVDIHRMTNAGWSRHPIATTDGRVNPKEPLFQNIVFALVPRDQAGDRSPSKPQPLPAGRYAARVFIDKESRLEDDRDYELGESDFVVEIDFHGDWPSGYQPPKVLSARPRNEPARD